MHGTETGHCGATQCLDLLAFAYIAATTLIGIWESGAAAQEAPPAASVTQRVDAWGATLDKISHDLNTLKLDVNQLEALSDQAVDIRSQALALADELKPFADEARELRDAFVSASPGEANESAEIEARGKELEARVAQFEGWLRETDLTVTRADQVLHKISSLRLAQLAKSLAERGPLPINPFVWWRAAVEGRDLIRFSATAVADSVRLWFQPGSESGEIGRAHV